MPTLTFALLCGLGLGTLSVLTMLPMPFDDKPRALAGAFTNRFAIGFLVPLTLLPLPGWLAGALVGLVISLPDAIITRAWAPILVFGALGGAIVGMLAGWAA